MPGSLSQAFVEPARSQAKNVPRQHHQVPGTTLSGSSPDLELTRFGGRVGHAAMPSWRRYQLVSVSIGVEWSRLECSRREVSQPSIQRITARRASARVAHVGGGRALAPVSRRAFGCGVVPAHPGGAHQLDDAEPVAGQMAMSASRRSFQGWRASTSAAPSRPGWEAGADERGGRGLTRGHVQTASCRRRRRCTPERGARSGR